MFVARNDTMASNPDLVRRVVRVLKRAMDWRIANLERSIDLSAALVGIPREALVAVAKSQKLLGSAELVKLTQDGTVEGWMATFNKLFASFGKLPNPLPPSEYYAGKLFVEA